jgi:hypothetical protein
MTVRRLALPAIAAATAGVGAAAVIAARRGRLTLRDTVVVPGEPGGPPVDLSADPTADLSGAGFPLRPAGRTIRAQTTARMVPPAWEPEVLTTLSRWIPASPTRPLARAAAYVWAAPMTAAGLVVGALTGARPQLRDGVVWFVGARGIAHALLYTRGFSAATFGHVVVARQEPTRRLVTHELVHVRQAERLGLFMAPVYLALYAVYGYARHPMERAARRAVRLAAGGPE